MKIAKKLISWIVVIGLLIWAGFTLVNNKKKSQEETQLVAQENDSISVNVKTISYEKIKSEYVANGTFQPWQELTFPSEVSGKVVRVLVEEGQLVKTGQNLAIVRADVESISLNTAEAAYQNALKNYQRLESALRTGGVTQQQVDGAQLELKNAEAQRDQARIQVGDNTIKSSINGVVNQRFIEPGSFVSPGTPMFEIVNVSQLKLRVEVDEQHVVNYEPGDSIKIRASVHPDKEFTGVIKFIASKATAALNFPLEIRVDNAGGEKLKAGMYGTAIFSSGSDEKKEQSILVVPRKAFVGGLNNTQVFVLDGDQKAYLKKISIGRNFGDQIEVLAGLEKGDQVVTGGQINLTDGALVRIIEEE